MSVFRHILESVQLYSVQLECYDRSGARVQSLTGFEFVSAVRRYRTAFTGWKGQSFCGHKVVGLLFKPEETIEFLVATFAALAEGLTVVPFYPNWSAETQQHYLQTYGVRAIAVGSGLLKRAQKWQEDLDRVVRVTLSELPPLLSGNEEPFPSSFPKTHPCAWIFTSGTSGQIPKCTVISHRNISAAVENILQLDFLRPGMALHSPLSTSHIFSFIVVLGILANRPGRLLFSDVQYLTRLSQECIGKIDGLILVPIVLNRMRRAFYDKLVRNDLEGDALRRLPLGVRKFLKKLVQRSETVMLEMENGRVTGFLQWPAVALSRFVFGKRISSLLGSPEFVVVGGAKPDLNSMAFFNSMGVRCLQGWGMTETTGPLAVCHLKDRFRGAFGTCGGLFDKTNARIGDDGELIIESPQVAEGYLNPDGTFVPFNGRTRTGDSAQFDSRGRLLVNGKVSDRITLSNGLNYNPILLEDRIAQADLSRANLIEEAVVVGDGQARLGCVIFLREVERNGPKTVEYLADLLCEVNSRLSAAEQIGPWTIHPRRLGDTDFLGPSGKLRRRLVEKQYESSLFVNKELDQAVH